MRDSFEIELYRGFGMQPPTGGIARLAAALSASQEQASLLQAELANTRAALRDMAGAKIWRLARPVHDFLSRHPRIQRFLAAIIRRLLRPRRGISLAPDADVQAVLACPLFDAAWYTDRNKTAPREPEGAAAHYLAQAASRATDPGPDFDASWYLDNNPDVHGSNPLLHYLRKGQYRLRPPSPAAQAATQQARRRALGLDLLLPRIRLAIGFAGPASDAKLARAARSAALAADGIACEMLWHADPTVVAPSCLQPVMPAAPDMTLPAAHNQLLESAAEQGVDLYLAADPRGIFDPACIAALLRMSGAAGHAALIAASDFPEENPKAFDIDTFDTGWAGGGCLLIPLTIATRLGGVEPTLQRHWAIDLSWRARQAGLGVKVCPPALFHIGRNGTAAPDWIHDDALSGAWQLARLWGQGEAASAIGAEILRHGGTLSTEVPLSNGRDPAMAEFAHGLAFAPVRW
jgi:hypothetical protein